jgi:dynein heavy chain
VRDQLDANFLHKNELNPLLEVSLKLEPVGETKFEAAFSPKIETGKNANTAASSSSLVAIVNNWIDDFYSIATFMPRLDGEQGSYIDDMKQRKEIKDLVKSVNDLMVSGSDVCVQYRNQFVSFAYLWDKDRQKTFEEFLGGSTSNPSVIIATPLSAFDEQIEYYKKVAVQINELPNSETVGWLKVDSRPIKNELIRLCEAWKSMYSNYLTSQVTSTLTDMFGFMDSVEHGIAKKVEPGDVDSLKEVLGYIKDMRLRHETTVGATTQASGEGVPVAKDPKKRNKFEQMQDIVQLLAKHDVQLPDQFQKNLDHGPEMWNSLYAKTLTKREELSPLQDAEAKKMKNQLLSFSERVQEFQRNFNDMAAFQWKSGVKAAYAALDKWQQLLVDMEKEATNYRLLQQLFELAPMDFKQLKTCREEIVMLKTMWDMSSHVLALFQDWMKTSFKRVDVDTLVEETKQLKKIISAFNANMKSWDSYSGLFNTVNNMLTSLPLVQDLRSPAMRTRHWDQLLVETHKKGTADPEDDAFSLEQLLALGLHNYVDVVRGIVDKASKELGIESILSKIETTWEGLNFRFKEHEELKCVIMDTVEDIIEVLEDNLVKLQNMSSMRYIEFFIERLTKWQTTLATVESVTSLWVEVQKTWANLYPIFVLSEDIRTQLPEDSRRFEGADKRWRAMMNVAKDVTKVTRACTEDVIKQRLDSSDGMYEMLTSMMEDLEKCQKSLADYLETKRRAFPRFYFVAPKDLVDILSKGSFPKQVMNHMSKLVEAINTLEFEEDSNVALKMISQEEEVVEFTTPYECKGAVENWLNGVLDTIRNTLQTILVDAHTGYVEQSRDQWLFLFPAQIVISASRVWFTAEVNAAFERQEEGNKNALKDYLKVCVDQLAKLTLLVQGKLTSGDRKKIITLITVDVHNRDIVAKLIDEKAENAAVFTWQSQLRYMLDETKGCTILIADAEFTYNYEYVGNCGCLVITPLTDRCYITLTQSLRLNMGGAPAGPAGTGKTETTKDLGRALGTAVYVFNCTEQMDYMSLGNIFKGLAMTGAWGCFDEFNRIRIGVLSVVATQFKSIIDAIKAKKDEFEFQHENITLKRTCGVFITMNPGYKGRTELPENLKALFRPCAMIVPDLMNICEIMLAAEGFIEAKGLAKKFVTLYQLNRELLSKQDHYDWGLRAIKSVLVIAGSLKRAEPEVSEEKILMRALRDTNLAKLSRDDVEIFKRLISDLFPKIEILAKKDPELEKCLKQATHELHLQTGENDIFIDKVVQFKELLDVRHSVFVLGPAGSGKSCVWKVLSGAFQLMDKKTQYQVMDPKAVTSFELYGYMHPVTRDWKDGLLSNFMREFSKSAHKNPKWLILDGDIDAEWIESMNTVMDDNKVLTLASNERIPLTPTMRMIFEISHLKNATPATVSRAGILFLNETDIGWAPFKESWIETREDDREKQTLERLFEKYAAPVLEWLKGRVKHIIPVSDINMIQTLCYILEGLLKPELCPPGSANDIYEHYFVFACVWAFGGALPPEDRQAFNSFFKKTFTTVKFPENNQSTVNWTVFDHYVMPEGNKLGHWQELVPVYTHDPELPFGEIVVNTVDTVRTSFVMNLLANNKKPVLLVGTAGTGKTTVIKEKLNKLDEDTIFMSINFNSNTDSLSLQAILEQKLEKKAGTRMGPPGRKGLIYFIDDLNMPNPDKYGTQSAIALLRQHMDYGYWFDRAKMTTRPVSSVQYLAAMNPKAGSFTVDDRFQRHFGTLCCSYPSPSDLTIIFRSIISGHLQQFTKPVRELASKLVQATIELHSKVSKEFLPTAVKFHYQFNLREISNIFQGLCLAQPAYYKEPLDLIKLWLHESYRVFSDRMMVEEDVQKFAGIIAGVGKARFELDNNNAEILTNAHSLLFTSFMTTTSSNEPIYTIVNDFNELKIMLQRKLEEYNNDNAAMNLELFQQAIQHVCRISRILFNPRGNALLVGVGGSGKQSLARLASFINNYEIAQITVTSSYSILDFKAFLINLYKRAGLKGQDFTFLLTDSQIVDEKMLVFVNDMLSSGYIPELFPDDEKLNICGSIQNEVKGLGKDTGADSCWAYFLEKVRSKLHVVLCFSPVGEQFRTWCRKFPAIINCTAIDWFHAWPNEALISVAARFLKDIELGGPEMTEQIAQHMAYVHQTVTQACVEFKMVERRHNYTTPKSFLELISIYKLLLNKKREELNEKIERLSNGLNKLRSSSAKVKDLQVTLKDEQVIVEEKKLATDELVKKVGKERNIVEQQSSVATEEERKTNIIVREVEQFEADCRKELEAAEPIVEKAIAALNTLDKKDLQELKSFSTPSEDVAMVCNTVMFLTAQKTIPRNPTWNDAKKMMANPTQFLDDLKKFDKENIPQANIDAVKPYLDEVKYPNFNFEAIKSKSSAAAGLCSWVINICKFDAINKQVEPKRQQLRAAQEKLEASKASLKKIQDKVKELQNKLALLMAEYEAANQEKLANEERAKRTQDKLNLAERLVNGLADENVRWANSINDLKIRDQTLVGDVLLAGAFLSYVGAFTKSYRLSFLDEKWLPDLKARKIPTTEGIDPLYGVLTEDAQVAQWNNEGLPSDRVSIENGAIVTNCSRWPLMIDPQLQAIKWIKNRESKNNLQIIQLNQKRYLEVVENAIYNGYPCIIENIGENIDSVLDPLLSRSFTKRNRTTFIKLGEKEVEYDERFKLYLQTKLSNPHYRPEIVAQTTLLNFIVTDQGLEDQLLATTVNKERPDLEVLRASYMKQLRQFKIELKECEDNLLFELSNAKGDILENKKLIENLEMTKEKSKQITISVVEIEENNKKIDVSRQVYRPVSVRGSMLYFLIDQLSNLDHMYQYSLEAFMVVFGKALDKAKAADTVDERVANITDSITETLFSYVSRGLFERHKLIFSTMLCFGILRKQNDIDANQLEFLLRGPKRFGEERPETVAGWCSEASWAAVKALTEIEANTTPAFSTLPADMAGSWRRWKEWCEFEKPEEKPLPLEWKNLEPFQKLLIIRCLRPDRLTWSVTNFVGSKIGTKYVVQAPMDLADSYVDAGPTTPIFFILSPGVDPVKSVESLGETLGFTESAGKLKNVSLGQGQEPIAEEGLEMAFRNGGWVILNNLHLTPEWLVILEKKLDHYAEVFARQRAAAAKKEEGRLAAAALANKTTTEGEEEKPAEEAEATTEGGEEQKKEPVEETQAPVNEKVEEKHDESDDEDDHDDKGHNDFRVFLSAEPSPKIPLGILQRSIKLTNEPPSGLRANLLRAFMQFNDSVWEASTKQTEFKGILFSLCFFHAVIVERKKFGPQGWNRNYPFSLGDLTTCIAVLNNYLEDRPKVPWEDLRYVFGEIMYGGHITDDWDRRLCSTYFAEYIRAEIVETIQLCPGFQSPPANLSYQGYIEYIDTQLPSESPTAFGLHPNAEIGFRTQQGESLFRMIVEMQPRSSSGGEGMSATDKVAQEIANILDRLPEQYNLGDIVERLDVGEERTPFQNSFYQECEYMNRLLDKLEKSLKELKSGLDGELTISDRMQSLMDSLSNNKVPESWAAVAYPSLRPLDTWVTNLLERCAQLTAWTQDLTQPKVVWLSGLFNPQSFLTAIMQSTARKMQWPLDKMTLVAEVTKKMRAEEIDVGAREGAYVSGFFLEGATWDEKKNSLVESKLKELYPKMPIIHIKAMQVEKSDPKAYFDCPVSF